MDGTVLEQLVSFTLNIWREMEERMKKNAASFFIVNILVKKRMEWTHSQIVNRTYIPGSSCLNWRNGGEKIYIYTYMLVSSPFEHHVSCHLFTDGYLRQGPWIYNDLVVHADQILTDPPWLAGFINYHSNFLFCHTFLSLFPCIKCKFVLAQFMQCAQMLSDKSSNNLIK